MANSNFLRKNKNQHSIKNNESKIMDKDIDKAILIVIENLKKEYPKLVFEHKKTIKIVEIIEILSKQYPEYIEHFGKPSDNSFIKPDGGFIFAINKQGERKIILVSEIKRQGTNDKRQGEGLPKQAKGNAIERLGKNLIGIRTLFKNEGILPFVCFGNGDDFKDGSTINDRVLTMNDFFSLNKIFVKKDYLPFEPSSMFFRYEPWSVEEMIDIMLKVSRESLSYKFI